jgi:N-terminal region of glycosyl transferase group 7/N-terminal domain of galactosyltransferase
MASAATSASVTASASATSTPIKKIPSTIFIVPYRNREAHLSMFVRYMPWILEVTDISSSYEVFVAHQADKREFNRGGMKNLGFIAAKQMYPHHYKDITFIFQDVDTLPGLRNMISFKTNPGQVHHYYGFHFALGGIFSIKGADFERINGFPNYWGWGFEDNCIQNRWTKAGGVIVRDAEYFKPADLNILQFGSGMTRLLDAHVTHKLLADTGKDGISSITNIRWNKEEIQPQYYMLHFTSWDVPEREDEVLFETRVAPKTVNQPVISMNSIMHKSAVQQKRQFQRRR